MATQIKVSSATGNVTVQLSRTVIGSVVTANTANYANFAGTANVANNLNATTTANVIIGGGVNGYVLQTNGAGVTSWVAQAGGGGTQPGGANTEVQYNDAGTMAGDPAFTFNDVTSTLTTGTISATNIGNITPTNLDGNVANVLRGDGTFAADAGGTYGDSNVVTLMGAFGSNTISTTGLITGNGGGLSNIVGANVTGEVTNAATANAVAGANVTGTVASATLASFATTANAVAGANVTGEVPFAAVANSVALANVAGAGNIASINLDGNVANVLSGDGTFIAAGGGGGSQTLAQVLTTGNLSGGTGITMSTTDKISFNDAQVNVHSSTDGTLNADADVEIQLTTPYIDMAADAVNMDGNLVVTGNVTTGPSLLVNGVDGNVLIQPNVALNGKTYSSLIRGEYNTSTANSTTDQAFITDNYTTQGITTLRTFANTAAGQLAEGPSLGFNNYAAIGNTNTDPLVAGQIDFFALPNGANLAKADTQTGTSLTMGGASTDGFLIVQGTNASDVYGSEVWKQFQYRPKSMGFIRRGGNADTRSSPVANDETSLNFYTTQTLSGVPGSLYNWPAKMGSKVDPGWTDPNLGSKGTPEGLFFTVVTEDFANLEHRMYANGDTIFNTSGGGTPITLGYNGVITGDGGGLSNISTSAGTSIVNGTSNVAVALNSDITAGVGGVADVLTLTTTGANVKTSLFVDNTDGNVLVDPNVAFQSNTFTNITRGKWDGSKSTLNTALVTDDYAGTGQFSQIMYANTTAGQTAEGPKIKLDNLSAIGNTNTDPYVTGQIDFSTAVANSNREATSTATHTSLSIAKPQSTNTSFGGITIDTGSNLHLGASEYQTATIQQYQYQNRGIEFYRRGGNAESLAGVAANDEVAFVSHMGSGLGGGVAFNSYSGKIAFKVDSAWVDPGNASQGVPQGIEFKVTDTNYAQLYHNMYANGTVTFNSAGPGTAVTIGSNGVITGDGGGLSNVSATATPAGFADSVQFNNGGTALGGDATFTYNSSSKQVTLNGAAAGAGGVPTFNLNNGGFNVNQEEIGGGAATFAFNNYYAGGLIAPSTYFRARGTRSSQTGVASGDQVVSDGYYVNSGAGHTYIGIGGQTCTVTSNDGVGGVNAVYGIDMTGTSSRVDLNAPQVRVSKALQMTDKSEVFSAGLIQQQAYTFGTLPTATAGTRTFITDGPATWTGGSLAAASGTNQLAPVYADGSDWRFG